jgi:hypothetical protein
VTADLAASRAAGTVAKLEPPRNDSRLNSVNLFEFVLALYVVLAGLGLTLLVRSIGQIIEARSRVKLYWIHTGWLVFTFLTHVSSWFLVWTFRDVESWKVGEFVLLLSVPTVLYLVSHVSVPEIPEDDSRHDLRSYYYARYRLILGLLGATILLNIANEYFLLDQFALTQLTAFRLTVLAALCVGFATPRPRVHAAVVVFLTLVLVAGLYGLDARLT